MLNRRATLGAVCLVFSPPVFGRTRSVVRLSEFGGRTDGLDASDAFEWALAAAARHGADLLLDEGTITVRRAPGEILNSLQHDVPEVRHATIRIRGAGSGRTRLLSLPRPTATNPRLPVSAPILKTVGATEVLLEGVTFDGGVRELVAGLRNGPDPTAAALVEVRGARRVVLRDVVLTGFAGHWDTRRPEDGNYGRRGPLLVAGCADVELTDLRLHYPSFREGPFVHDAARLRVKGFRFVGPPNLDAGSVSTPLNILGYRTGEVLVEDFATSGAWGGSLMNLGGPGAFTLRRIRAEGRVASVERPAVDRRSWGRGIDIGAEINTASDLDPRCTDSLTLEDVLLRNVTPYGIKATRRPDCSLRRLSLSSRVELDGGFEALQAAYVHEIEGLLRANHVLRFEGTRPGGAAVGLLQCGGRLELDINGAAPEGNHVRSGIGVIRTASSALTLSGFIRGFAGGALREDVRELEDDGLWDAVSEDLQVETAREAIAPAIIVGRGPNRRLRRLVMSRCRLDGVPLTPKMPGLVVSAFEASY